MTTLKSDQQRTIAAARRAERERDAVKALKDYKAEKQAIDQNMMRLRALRLAKENADRKRHRDSN
jgi:hypothetical protein